MNFVALFFAGAFLCNCIPHLSAGLQGLPFPTPFAKPRGIGKSSPFLNFIWGVANLMVGVRLTLRHPFAVELSPEFTAFAVGGLIMGSYLSRHFGKVQAAATSR